MNVIGIDVGRSQVKVWTPKSHFLFQSKLVPFAEPTFDEKGDDDLIIQYQGETFSGGTLADRENEYGGQMMIENKIHKYTVINTLTGLHKACKSGPVGLVTNLPVKQHSKDKKRLKRLLDGCHHITINQVPKYFEVKCEVAPEGIGFFKFASSNRLIRGLNIGSRTVNAITFKDGMKIGVESDTFDYGMETGKQLNLYAMAAGIASQLGLMRWKSGDIIFLSGGGAAQLLPYLKEFFPNLHLTSIFTDAEALYLTACEIYG